MKFIQLILGLNSGIATYACPWCKVAKDNRGDISKPYNFYNETDQVRTLSEMKSLASGAKIKYGVKHSPLLNIEINKYIPDELHLVMRITDVLLRNLIDDAKSKDEYGKLMGHSTDNLELLINAIHSCGVTFKTWISKTGELEWTSLSGADKRKLLRLLPDRLLFCLHEDTKDSVVLLWRQFLNIVEELSNRETNIYNEEAVFASIHSFVEHFLELGKQKNITPYLHVLLYHVPYFVSRYGNLSPFSGQGVEKTNDIVKQIHQTKTNKHDATKDALLIRKRIELGHLSEVTRTKRKYEKNDEIYWTLRAQQIIKNKKQKIKTEMDKAEIKYRGRLEKRTELSLEDLTIPELKCKLKELGVNTKVRKKEKLIELIKNMKTI